MVIIVNKLAIKLIKKYQESTRNHKKRCKYVPSCSNYALDCYKEYNFFIASILTFWRILRCNPLSNGGYDPIPKYKVKKPK